MNPPKLILLTFKFARRGKFCVFYNEKSKFPLIILLFFVVIGDFDFNGDIRVLLNYETYLVLNFGLND